MSTSFSILLFLFFIPSLYNKMYSVYNSTLSDMFYILKIMQYGKV